MICPALTHSDIFIVSGLGRICNRRCQYVFTPRLIITAVVLIQISSDTYNGVGKHTQVEPAIYVTVKYKVCFLYGDVNTPNSRLTVWLYVT